MNTITWSNFKPKTRAELEELMPVAVSFDGDIVGIFSKADDVIVVGDMHPRVQIQLRAKEQLVRRGMPNPEKIT